MAKMFGKIVVLKKDGLDGSSVPMMQKLCVIGRNSDCDIRIKLPTVSAKHCQLEIVDDKVVFTNLSETNPALVNNIVVKGKTYLRDKDVFSVTTRSFRWEGGKPKENAGGKRKDENKLLQNELSNVPNTADSDLPKITMQASPRRSIASMKSSTESPIKIAATEETVKQPPIDESVENIESSPANKKSSALLSVQETQQANDNPQLGPEDQQQESPPLSPNTILVETPNTEKVFEGQDSNNSSFDFSAHNTPKVPMEMFVSPMTTPASRKLPYSKDDSTLSLAGEISLANGEAIDSTASMERSSTTLTGDCKTIANTETEHSEGVKRAKCEDQEQETREDMKRKGQSTPVADYTDVAGVKRLMAGSPVADYGDISGIQQLMETPESNILPEDKDEEPEPKASRRKLNLESKEQNVNLEVIEIEDDTDDEKEEIEVGKQSTLVEEISQLQAEENAMTSIRNSHEGKTDELELLEVKTCEPKVLEGKIDESKLLEAKTDEVLEVKCDESEVLKVKTGEPKVLEVKTDEPKVLEVKPDEPKVLEVNTEEPELFETKTVEIEILEGKCDSVSSDEPEILEGKSDSVSSDEPEILEDSGRISPISKCVEKYKPRVSMKSPVIANSQPEILDATMDKTSNANDVVEKSPEKHKDESSASPKKLDDRSRSSTDLPTDTSLGNDREGACNMSGKSEDIAGVLGEASPENLADINVESENVYQSKIDINKSVSASPKIVEDEHIKETSTESATSSALEKVHVVTVSEDVAEETLPGTRKRKSNALSNVAPDTPEASIKVKRVSIEALSEKVALASAEDLVEVSSQKPVEPSQEKLSETLPEKPADALPEKEANSSEELPEKEANSSEELPEKEANSLEELPEKEANASEELPEKEINSSEELPEKNEDLGISPEVLTRRLRGKVKAIFYGTPGLSSPAATKPVKRTLRGKGKEVLSGTPATLSSGRMKILRGSTLTIPPTSSLGRSKGECSGSLEMSAETSPVEDRGILDTPPELPPKIGRFKGIRSTSPALPVETSPGKMKRISSTSPGLPVGASPGKVTGIESPGSSTGASPRKVKRIGASPGTEIAVGESGNSPKDMPVAENKTPKPRKSTPGSEKVVTRILRSRTVSSVKKDTPAMAKHRNTSMTQSTKAKKSLKIMAEEVNVEITGLTNLDQGKLSPQGKKGRSTSAVKTRTTRAQKITDINLEDFLNEDSMSPVAELEVKKTTTKRKTEVAAASPKEKSQRTRKTVAKSSPLKTEDAVSEDSEENEEDAEVPQKMMTKTRKGKSSKLSITPPKKSAKKTKTTKTPVPRSSHSQSPGIRITRSRRLMTPMK